MVRWRALVWLGVLLWPNMAKAEYLQVLKYVGMHCSRVQKDSLAHPRNEVFINTIVQDMGSGRAFDRKLPTGRPFYRNVSAGFTARGPVTTLWSGRAAGLRLLVAMWEHDGGGGSVDEFSYALVAAAKVYFIVQSGGAAAAGRGVRGAAAMAARGPKPGQASPEPGAIDRFFARNMRTVLGANHDLLGHASVRIDGGDWHAAPLRIGLRHPVPLPHRPSTRRRRLPSLFSFRSRAARGRGAAGPATAATRR